MLECKGVCCLSDDDELLLRGEGAVSVSGDEERCEGEGTLSPGRPEGMAGRGDTTESEGEARLGR